GRPFTWFKPNGNAMSRLDRIMKNTMNNSISLGMMLQLLQISGQQYCHVAKLHMVLHNGQSVAGCGGVIRDNNSVWRGGFANNLGICSAYVAELWGVVFEGLRYARRLGFNRIELEVDYWILLL
ncbi:ribonuclease H, partial [Trifolium pratense]